MGWGSREQIVPCFGELAVQIALVVKVYRQLSSGSRWARSSTRQTLWLDTKLLFSPPRSKIRTTHRDHAQPHTCGQFGLKRDDFSVDR